MRRRECELVEVVFDGLDLAIVAHLETEAEERILDHAPHLCDRVQMAERERLARQRHVDDLVAQAPVELRAAQAGAALGDGRLEPAAHAVQQHPGLAVANAAQRLGQLRLPPEHAHAHVVELRLGARGGDRSCRLLLVRRPVHGGDTIQGFLLASFDSERNQAPVRKEAR